ncbi:hypothetical protein LXA43DRAFT_1105363 [Ganoderma leucocontextum]|nr:hypothetical protein LXA43DRAFT_1105363 [Ganoderma leucocontextum]
MRGGAHENPYLMRSPASVHYPKQPQGGLRQPKLVPALPPNHASLYASVIMAFSVNSPITFYVFPEPWENRLFGPIDRVTILIDSRTMTVPFTVPTGDFDPEQCTPEFFERWIQRVQGPTVSRTGITEEERKKLLHFALSYRGFYAGRADIPRAAYYEFVGLLVAETLSLRQPEPAAYVLEAAVEWLLGNLPADVFDEVEVPPVVPYTPTADEESEIELPAGAPSAFSPTSALIEMCTFLVPALTTYGERGPAVRTEGQTLLRIPPTGVSPEREFIILPTAPQKGGYDSDDSMPSLRYVTDSSDDSDSE